MNDYKLIAKGETARTAENFVSIGQYLFVRERGGKFLYLKLFNGSGRTVTGLKISVSQRDASGKDAGVVTFECSGLNALPGSTFVLDRGIALDANCAYFTAEVLAADSGEYTFTSEEGRVTAEYRGEARENSPDAVLSKSGTTVEKKSFKAPLALGIVAVLTALCMIVATVLYLNQFKKTSNGFLLDGIRYTFVAPDKSKESGVYVSGYSKTSAKVVIPEKAGGYPVLEIAYGAFSSNTRLRELTVKGATTISDRAFSDCNNLQTVLLEKSEHVKIEAFANCTSLRSFTAYNLDDIESYAFSNCYSLWEILLSNEEKTLYLAPAVFSQCYNLDTVTINQFLYYPYNNPFIDGASYISSLYLKNFNYGEGRFGACDIPLNEAFGGVGIRELTIQYMDDIPDRFAMDNYLETFRVENLAWASVGDYAFQYTALREFVSEPLQQIGSGAFRGTQIQSIDLSSVQTLGEFAFQNCSMLTEVKGFGGNVWITELPSEIFSGCSSLENISLPPNLKTIGDRAFLATGLISVELPSGVMSIGDEAFVGCYNLKEAILNEGLISIGMSAFGNCRSLRSIVLPTTVAEIRDGAFINCTKLFDVYNYSRLPIMRGDYLYGGIAQYAFKVYRSADETPYDRIWVNGYFFAFPDGESEWVLADYTGRGGALSLPERFDFEGKTVSGYRIASGAFSDNDSITSVSLPACVTSVGSEAFARCYELLSADFSGGIGEIERDVLGGCNQISSLTVGYLGRSAEESGGLSYYFYGYIPPSLISLKITSSVAYILPGAFSQSSLASVRLPDSVKEIGEEAFYNCYNLYDVNFPESLETIGERAFFNCSRLTAVTLPTSLDTIKDYAFWGCHSLETVYNLSGLTLTAGDRDYGYVAYYAKNVYNDLNRGETVKSPEAKLPADGKKYNL